MKAAKKRVTKKPAAPVIGEVFAKYKGRYQDGGVDDLAKQITAHVSVDGKIDPARLKAFAKANGSWVDRYGSLGVGMQKMNSTNRLRKLLREGHKVVWPGESKKGRGKAKKPAAKPVKGLQGSLAAAFPATATEAPTRRRRAA